MGRKKTHEEYVEELKIKNPDVEVLEKYKGANVKILHGCLRDGCNCKWMATPHNILRGRGCPKCSGSYRRSREEYIDELKVKNSSIELVGEYIDTQTKTIHHCLIHDVYWESKPAHVLAGHGCPECQIEKIKIKTKKSLQQYIDDVRNINPDIDVIGDEYINAHTPILHKCKIDGCEWMAKPNNILSGKGCPKCIESRGEKSIQKWLCENKIVYIFQKTFDNCKDKKALPFDFYLPDYNVCIEYQGEQHYRPIEYFGGKEKFEIQQMHDQIKRNYCKENNINLLEIPYYKDVEKELNNFLFI